jgi:hypothetical protein
VANAAFFIFKIIIKHGKDDVRNSVAFDFEASGVILLNSDDIPPSVCALTIIGL